MAAALIESNARYVVFVSSNNLSNAIRAVTLDRLNAAAIGNAAISNQSFTGGGSLCADPNQCFHPPETVHRTLVGVVRQAIPELATVLMFTLGWVSLWMTALH